MASAGDAKRKQSARPLAGRGVLDHLEINALPHALPHALPEPYKGVRSYKESKESLGGGRVPRRGWQSSMGSVLPKFAYKKYAALKF